MSEKKQKVRRSCLDKRETLTAAVRVVSVRLLLEKVELDTVGTALKAGLVTPDEALDWLRNLRALPLIEAVIGGNNG
jgi:hypothetical protein